MKHSSASRYLHVIIFTVKNDRGTKLYFHVLMSITIPKKNYALKIKLNHFILIIFPYEITLNWLHIYHK